MRAVEDNIACDGCLHQLKSPPHKSATVEIVHNLDRGGLRYPSPRFVNFFRTLESAANSAQTELLALRKPLLTFVQKVLPAIASNPLFSCEVNDSQDHRTALATLVVRKFMRPFLTNIASNITEDLQAKNVIKEKPTSRKVLKV